MEKVRSKNSVKLDLMFEKILKEGYKTLDGEGNVVVIDPPAAILNAIRQRQRDLGIDVRKQKQSDDMVARLREQGIVVGIDKAKTA